MSKDHKSLFGIPPYRAAAILLLLLAGTPSAFLASAARADPQWVSDHDQVRIIINLPSTTRISLQGNLQACSTIHQLIDGLAISCPKNVAQNLLQTGLAVEDKLLQMFDVESDRYISADDAWAAGFRGAGIPVAVLDSGVDSTHSELSGSILASANFAAGPNRDTVGHGTHVIGIITANGGREITGGSSFNLADPNQATGAAPEAFILSARVCRDRCFTSDVEQGIEWAVQQGARVINLSLGGGNFGGHCDSDRLAAKANWAVDQGVVVVASAGNDAAGVSSPACGSKVIAVGAVYQRNIGLQDYFPTCIDETTAPDQIVCFSNTGPALDIVAPGAGILSTYSCHAAGDCTREWYAWGWGTSQASPHIAAVAAQILSANPTLTPAEVKKILETTARDLGFSGRDDTFGWGVVDALAAVVKAAGISRDLRVTSVSPARAVAYSGPNANPIPIRVDVRNEGGLTESFEVEASANTSPISTISVSGLGPGQSTTVTLDWDMSNIPAGTYTVSARAGPVTGEVDLSDNSMTDGTVEIRKVGDVNGDGDVDLDDLVDVFLNQFTANILYDVDNDGDIDLDDVVHTYLNQFV